MSQVWRGPWRGMDLREGEAEPNTYALGINVDTSGGQLCPRGAFSVCTDPNASARPRLHYLNRPGMPERIISVGPSTAIGPAVYVYSRDVGTLTPVAGTLPYEPVVDGWRCSIVDVDIPGSDPHPAVLITTPVASYLYDYRNDISGASGALCRRVIPATDSARLYDEANYYVDQAMPGYIACVHKGRVFYAGFEIGQTIAITGVLASEVSTPAVIIDPTRRKLLLGPNVLACSDVADPCAVPDCNFLLVDSSETITALHSTGEVLLVFTDRSIWALTGAGLADWNLTKVLAGTGCAAHASVVSIGGVTYFAGVDGIYAFGGLGSPEAVKLTTPIDALWNGDVSQFIPEAFRDQLDALGWPWRINSDDIKFMVGKLYKSRNQIWWSLPVIGTWKPGAMPVTAVYDLELRGWNLYCVAQNDISGRRSTPMLDAVQVGNRWFTAGGVSSDTDESFIQEYGAARMDGAADELSNPTGVPFYWLSRRSPEFGDDFMTMKAVRLRMLNSGVMPTATGETVGSGGVATDLPMLTVDGETSAFDYEDDTGTDIHAQWDQRQTRTAAITTTPSPESKSVLGEFVLGTSLLGQADWFTSEVYVTMKSRYFRIGLVDDSRTTVRSAGLRVASIALDIENRQGPKQ